MPVPKSLTLTFSQGDIAKRVQSLGETIGDWAKETQKSCGEQPLAICVLRGGIFFFADLLRAIDISIEPTFCRTWSYSLENNTQNSNSIRTNVDDISAKNRPLLLVDDICDSGATLKKLEETFVLLGASTVKSVVLIHRTMSPQQYTPTWTAFEYAEKDWFVGYGMDDKNRNANLPDIYTLGVSEEQRIQQF